MKVQLTSGTPQGDIYQEVIRRHRVPRATPREDISSMVVMEDPAPDWVVNLLTTILRHASGEFDHGRGLIESALAWCKAGNAERRSKRLVAFIQNAIGPRPPWIRLFLASAQAKRMASIAIGF